MTQEPLPLDTQAIKALAKILKDTDLSEIEYEAQNRRIRVARHINVNAASVAWGPAPATVASPTSETSRMPSSQEVSSKLYTVTSPMVGTAYLAPTPGASPFVRVGDRISEGQTVMIIEAMKVMNPIKASKSGLVQHIFVTDGTPVEFGEPLLALE